MWYHLYVESKNYNKLVNSTEKKQTPRYREQSRGYQCGEQLCRGGVGRGQFFRRLPVVPVSPEGLQEEFSPWNPAWTQRGISRKVMRRNLSCRDTGPARKAVESRGE